MSQSIAKSRFHAPTDGLLVGLIALMWAGAGLGVALSLLRPYAATSLGLILVATLAAVVSERFAVPLSGALELSIMGPLILVTAASGQLWAGICIAVGAECAAGVGAERWRPWVWVPERIIEVVVTLACVGYLQDRGAGDLEALAFGAIAMMATNVAMLVVVLLGRRKSLASVWPAVRADLPVLLLVPIVWGVSRAYASYGITALVVVFAPMLILQYGHRLYGERAKAIDAVNEASLSFAIGLVRALDAADPSTAGHSAQVAVYARDTVRQLGYDEDYASAMQLAALLHDIGKVGVQTQILRKEEKLDDDEWNEVRTHPATGETIVSELPSFDRIGIVIRHHHERPDGRGYPDGLEDGGIPFGSLVIGVVDAYSAMVQNRFYSAGRAPSEAIGELRKHAGTQFDGHVVDAFIEVLDRFGDEYQRGATEEFDMEVQRTQVLGQLGRIDRLHSAICKL